MPAPVAGIHVFLSRIKTWMAGTSPAMTEEKLDWLKDAKDGSLPRHSRYRRNLFGFRLSQRVDRRGHDLESAIDARRSLTRHIGRRRVAHCARREAFRHLLFLSRHHGRHQ